MRQRIQDTLPSLYVLLVLAAVGFFVSGALIVGFVSLTPFTDETQASPKPQQPTMPESYPPGYMANSVNVTEAAHAHLQALTNKTPITYTKEITRPNMTIITRLTMAESASISGTRTVIREDGSRTVERLSSVNGTVFKYRDLETGDIREEIYPKYGTGVQALQTILSESGVRLVSYDSTEQESYTYEVYQGENETVGEVIVNGDGRVDSLWYMTSTATGEARVSVELDYSM